MKVVHFEPPNAGYDGGIEGLMCLRRQGEAVEDIGSPETCGLRTDTCPSFNKNVTTLCAGEMAHWEEELIYC